MKINSLLIVVLSTSNCFSQSARDYFFPSSDKNVSVYIMKGVSKLGLESLVYYKDMGDSARITTVYPDYEGKFGWKEEVVKIDGSKISLVRLNSNIYNPQSFETDEAVVLKLPENGKSSTSQYVQGSTKNTYLAEFLLVTIDGKERKAIKITKSSEMNRSGKKLMSYSDYFVSGIGYYKRTSDDTTIEMLKEQKYDPNPPALK